MLHFNTSLTKINSGLAGDSTELVVTRILVFILNLSQRGIKCFSGRNLVRTSNDQPLSYWHFNNVNWIKHSTTPLAGFIDHLLCWTGFMLLFIYYIWSANDTISMFNSPDHWETILLCLQIMLCTVSHESDRIVDHAGIWLHWSKQTNERARSSQFICLYYLQATDLDYMKV